MERRPFLTSLAAMAVRAIAAFLALPTLVYLASPFRGRRPEEGGWIDLGSIKSLPEGIPALVPYEVAVEDGWQKRSRPASAWVIRRGADFRVFTSTCPHLGCAVRWNHELESFRCPCHASAFAADGRRLEGPAPRGLDPLPWKADGDRLLVQHQAFRPGVARRTSA